MSDYGNIQRLKKIRSYCMIIGVAAILAGLMLAMLKWPFLFIALAAIPLFKKAHDIKPELDKSIEKREEKVLADLREAAIKKANAQKKGEKSKSGKGHKSPADSKTAASMETEGLADLIAEEFVEDEDLAAEFEAAIADMTAQNTRGASNSEMGKGVVESPSPAAKQSKEAPLKKAVQERSLKAATEEGYLKNETPKAALKNGTQKQGDASSAELTQKAKREKIVAENVRKLRDNPKKREAMVQQYNSIFREYKSLMSDFAKKYKDYDSRTGETGAMVSSLEESWAKLKSIQAAQYYYQICTDIKVTEEKSKVEKAAKSLIAKYIKSEKAHGEDEHDIDVDHFMASLSFISDYLNEKSQMLSN